MFCSLKTFLQNSRLVGADEPLEAKDWKMFRGTVLLAQGSNIGLKPKENEVWFRPNPMFTYSPAEELKECSRELQPHEFLRDGDWRVRCDEPQEIIWADLSIGKQVATGTYRWYRLMPGHDQSTGDFRDQLLGVLDQVLALLKTCPPEK